MFKNNNGKSSKQQIRLFSHISSHPIAYRCSECIGNRMTFYTPNIAILSTWDTIPWRPARAPRFVSVPWERSVGGTQWHVLSIEAISESHSSIILHPLQKVPRLSKAYLSNPILGSDYFVPANIGFRISMSLACHNILIIFKHMEWYSIALYCLLQRDCKHRLFE